MVTSEERLKILKMVQEGKIRRRKELTDECPGGEWAVKR